MWGQLLKASHPLSPLASGEVEDGAAVVTVGLAVGVGAGSAATLHEATTRNNRIHIRDTERVYECRGGRTSIPDWRAMGQAKVSSTGHGRPVPWVSPQQVSVSRWGSRRSSR